ncbi:coiled-coil domain-containing protein 180 [Centroberyx gerrardi]
MWESRAVPSGKVYRQLFDAQVQLSRSLLAGRGGLKTTLIDRPSSDIIERLRVKKRRDQSEALEQLYTQLAVLSQDHEARCRTACVDLLSCLEALDLRLDSLMDRMEQLEHLEQLSQQQLYGLWEEVEEEVEERRSRIRQLDQQLSESEAERSSKISVLLRTSCCLLENISCSQPSDLHRLIHTEAMMMNQSLLANRRSAARLLLRLLEENLQQESLLRLRWEESRRRWRSSRVSQVIDGFRELSSSEAVQNPASVQQTVLQMRRTQQELTEQRCQLIQNLCSLAPPTCSTALVSDWYNQLTAVNHKIGGEALSALQLSEEEVQDIISSQLLTLIGRCQSQAEDRLAALDRGFDSLARRALGLSRCVFVLLRGAALLWETHSRNIETREEELQRQLDDLRRSQEQEIQKKKVRLDVLLDGLRQQSSEETLQSGLQEASRCLLELTQRLRSCSVEQWQLLERLPALLLEELSSYSSELSRYYHTDHSYSLSPEELKNLYPSINPVKSGMKEQEMTEKHPISCQESDPGSAHDWLTEVDSSLLDLWDSGSSVTFTSRRGGTYSGAAFICLAPEPLDGLEQETKLALFPVELLTHTLTRVRVLFFEHLEQRFHDVLSSSVATVTDRKEALRSEQELQLQLLDPQHIQTHIHNPRRAELLLHRQRVAAHCQGVLDVLTGCRSDLLQHQASISRRSRQLADRVSSMEDGLLHTSTLQRLECLCSTLQDCLDHHIEETQRCQTDFRQSVHLRLEQLRQSTAVLLRSFRLFSEGGDFSPQEVDVFQKCLQEESRQIDVTEESIQSELEVSECSSLQQVKEVSGRFEEKFSFLKIELKFLEKIQKVLSNTQVQIKAEAASSNQQQKVISSRMEELRRLMETTEVSPQQVCSLLSSLSQELRQRCRHLDCCSGSFALAARLKSRKQDGVAPPPGLLQPCRGGVAFSDDAAVGVVKALNKLSRIQHVAEAAEPEQRGTAAPPGQSPSPQPLRHKSTESVSGQSVRRVCRSTRTDRRFQVFGSKPEAEQNTHSFRSIVNSVLWKANDILLLVAEDFYRKERRGVGRFHFLSDSLDQCAESLNQRLLGYQEQARQYHSTSIQEFGDQLRVLEQLLCSLPGVLFSNQGRRQEAELMEEVGGVRRRLEETLQASEEQKRLHVSRLRVALSQPAGQEGLEDLRRREEQRGAELHTAVCRAHLELQDCVRVRGEEFVTSLSSLTESLLFQLDNLLTPGVTQASFNNIIDHVSIETEAAPDQAAPQSEHHLVTMETGQQQQQLSRGSRTWPGVSFLSPADTPTATASSITVATTASITTAKCTLGHLAVIQQRDAALKRFERLYRSQLLRSDADRRRRLAELQSWNTHWEQQIHTLTHTHTDTHSDTHTLTHTY